jgi:hypothetical protein
LSRAAARRAELAERRQQLEAKRAARQPTPSTGDTDRDARRAERRLQRDAASSEPASARVRSTPDERIARRAELGVRREQLAARRAQLAEKQAAPKTGAPSTDVFKHYED